MILDEEKIALKEALFTYGNAIVEAPPGTGKTFSGVYLAREAYRNGWICDNQKTLILTFSRNARIQIEEEVDRFIIDNQLTKNEVGSICVSNYHSLYFEHLQRNKGFWGIRKIRPATKDEEKLRDDSQKIIDGIKNGTPRYDDFPKLFFQLIKSRPSLLIWLREVYPFVILDEFQDTDSLQWEIIQLWKPKHILIFYDRFQMIYKFRNADINNIQKAINLYNIPESAIMNLTKIYRLKSENSLCGYIRELRLDDLGGTCISAINSRSWLSVKPCNMTQQPRIFVRCASRIRYMNQEIDFSETTAIITLTNQLAKSLQESLSKKSSGVVSWYCSCRLITGENDSAEEARNLLLKLRKCRNEKELRGWIGELFDNMLISNDKISFKKEFKKDKADMLAGRSGLLKTMHEEYQTICDDVNKQNIRAVGLLLNYVIKYAKQYVSKESKLDPDWYYYIQQFAKLSNAFPLSKNWDDYCEALENKILMISQYKRTTTGGITIMNVHQSKGRQFDHVIIPWLSENGESPTLQQQGRKFDYNSLEDRRLLYVALTRAKKRVTIIYPVEQPAEILKKWKLI